MVMELVPRDGDGIRAVLSIYQAIVLVFVACKTVAGKVIVVNPDLGAGIDIDLVLAVGSIVELEVPDNHVGHFPDLETAAGKTRIGAYAEDGGVGDKLDDSAARKVSGDLDDTTGFGSGRQCRARGDGGARAGSASGGSSSVTDKLVDCGSTRFDGTCGGGGASGQSQCSGVDEAHYEFVSEVL